MRMYESPIKALAPPDRLRDVPAHWARGKKIEWLLDYAWKWRNSFARQPAYSDICPDDLYSVMAIAVTQAVDDYDVARNTKLTTYAIRRAKYAALEAYRLYSHSTRSMRESGQFVQWLSMDTALSSGSTLGTLIAETRPHPSSDTFSDVLGILELDLMRAYISRLNEREQSVVHGILSEISFKDLAKTLHVSESSVYQIMNKSISKLRGMASLDAIKERQRELKVS